MRAIAVGWDSRRIAYKNEGEHPFEAEVAALLGVGAGHAPEHVAVADELVRREEATLAADPLRRAGRAPLERLAAEIGANPVALDIVRVVAAPQLRGETTRLYGILANDPARALCDELLVTQILAGRHGRHAIARELEPDRPLVGLGVVRVDGDRRRPFAGLSLDAAALARLRRDRFHEFAVGATRTRRATRRLDEIAMPDDVRRELVTQLAAASSPPARLVMRGLPGSGRRTALAALAASANRRLGVIDVALFPGDPAKRAQALASELGRAVVRGLLPCLTGLDEGLATPAERELIRRHPGPLCFTVLPDARPPCDPGFLCFDLPRLAEAEHLRVWRQALDARGVVIDDVTSLARRWRVPPGTIVNAVDQVATGTTTEPEVALDRVLSQTMDARIGAWAERIRRLARLDEVVLSEDVGRRIRELVLRVRHRERVFETWGFDRVMRNARGLTALFTGEPGTGKTLVASAIAAELRRDLYRIDVARVVSKWVGDTERSLGAIFDAAEGGQAILLFDEADSLFARRTEVKTSNDRHSNREVNYLLERMDAFDGIAILTSNHDKSIDDAFKRRISFKIAFPFPDPQLREQIWRAHLPPELPMAGDLNLGILATKYKLAGGHIRNAALRAAFFAADEDRPLAQRHLVDAVELEMEDVGKLCAAGRSAGKEAS